jgi:hypothetical protein
VAIVPRLGGDDGGRPARPGTRETIAEAYALTYATLAQAGEARSACSGVSGKAARTIGCGTAHPRIASCGPFKADDSRVLAYDDSHAAIHVGTCTIKLLSTPEWVVTEAVQD